MDLMQTSEEWSRAHQRVNDLLATLLNALRDLGYNPSFHISYDHEEHHVIVDPSILDKHENVAALFDDYRVACHSRDEAVRRIESMPKIDLGFESQ